MVKIDESRCVGCGQCAKDCISLCLEVEEGKAVFRRSQDCLLCGHCEAICPAGAISLDSGMEEVRRRENLEPTPSVGALLDMIRFRRSVRQYQARPVEREKIENLLQAGRYTATGANRQGVQFTVVQEKLSELKPLVWGRLKEAADGAEGYNEFFTAVAKRILSHRDEESDYLFRDAPAVFYLAAASTVDAALAAQNIELTAVAQGLGVLYNGILTYFTSKSPEALALIRADERPLALCMLLGYPSVRYLRTVPRKPADAILL
jgi:nitroreductase/NAD-dependent dihydropyrimidine dehydrogenase PreA subunit